MQTNHNELYHYGVKGMRWGERHDNDTSPTSSTSSTTKQSSYKSKNAKKALKTGATVVAVGLAAYGTHKIINDPRTISAGKKLIKTASSTSKNITSNAKKSITSSTEYKIATMVGKPVISKSKQAINFVGSDKFTRTAAGIGGMAATAQLLRSNVKDLKMIKDSNQDDFDKVMNTVKKGSDIGVNVGTLAKGPAGNNYRNNNSGSNKLLKQTRDLKKEIGDPEGMRGHEDERRYQDLFRRKPSDDQRALIKAMRKNGYSVRQIEQYVYHSDTYSNEIYHSIANGVGWRLLMF